MAANSFFGRVGRQMVTAAIAVTIVVQVLACLPSTPIDTSFIRSPLRQTLFPQGWGFFSRNPRAERIVAFQPNLDLDGVWTPLPARPSLLEARLGFDRSHRAGNRQLGMILEELDRKDWRACQSRIDACLQVAEYSAVIQNDTSKPVVCGPIGLVKQDPIPFAWAEFRDEVKMPILAAKVFVQC